MANSPRNNFAYHYAGLSMSNKHAILGHCGIDNPNMYFENGYAKNIDELISVLNAENKLGILIPAIRAVVGDAGPAYRTAVTYIGELTATLNVSNKNSRLDGTVAPNITTSDANKAKVHELDLENDRLRSVNATMRKNYDEMSHRHAGEIAVLEGVISDLNTKLESEREKIMYLEAEIFRLNGGIKPKPVEKMIVPDKSKFNMPGGPLREQLIKSIAISRILKTHMASLIKCNDEMFNENSFDSEGNGIAREFVGILDVRGITLRELYPVLSADEWLYNSLFYCCLYYYLESTGRLE